MTPPPLTITNEQVNNLPLLLGIMSDMGIRDVIDAHVTPYGNWDGASVGTVLSIWLSHILQKRGYRMVAVRDWATDRVQTINTLLDITLRDTDCTDDRLDTLLTMLGGPTTQAALDAALLQRWVRIYHLPTETVRLDNTRSSVYHDDVAAYSLLQHGYSKDHRPNLSQFKLMLATLDLAEEMLKSSRAYPGAAYSFGKCASRPHRAALADSSMPSQCDGDMAAYPRSETLRRTQRIPLLLTFAKAGVYSRRRSPSSSQFPQCHAAMCLRCLNHLSVTTSCGKVPQQ